MNALGFLIIYSILYFYTWHILGHFLERILTTELSVIFKKSKLNEKSRRRLEKYIFDKCQKKKFSIQFQYVLLHL